MSISTAVKNNFGLLGGRKTRSDAGSFSQTRPRRDEGRRHSDAALTMASSFKDRNLLAVIGDEVGLILNHNTYPILTKLRIR